MSSNQNNNGNDNDGSDTIIAIVALVVSVIALIGTVLQVAQQYMASAAGYSNCDASVIGPWGVTKKRRFRLSEMRFQVLFETPVFFVCPAENKKGPLEGDIYFVKGDPQSIDTTRSLQPSDSEKQQQQPSDKLEKAAPGHDRWAIPKLAHHVLHDRKFEHDLGGVHTADNEMSTWVVLLQELHRMERDSRMWQTEQAALNPPEPTCTFNDHKLCVAVQAKKRSWDTMPPSISRPYAASTICHLIEMAAMLGIYWKEFDRSAGRYRAEGNGYVLTGSHMPDLGIMFTFQICGQSRFKENRIIPADEVKELAFGLVPTIFRENKDLRRLAFSADDTRSLDLLLLGSRNELAETLALIGCNTSTSNSLRDEKKKHGHLFPLAFEITGMLGQTLRIRTSLFRFLPNPTFYHWDKKYFSMSKLLKEYGSQISRMDSDEPQVKKLREMASETAGLLSPKQERAGAEHDQRAAENAIDRLLMNKLHDNLDACDIFLKEKGQQKVELVLREHIQEMLCMVNGEGKYGATVAQKRSSGPGTGSSSGVPLTSGTGEPSDRPNTSKGLRETLLHFDDVMTASPEDRQTTLMTIYFSRLRHQVVRQAEEAWLQQDESRRSEYGGESETSSNKNTANDPRQLGATSVWCTLVFRMLCWLLLHDFNKMDVQISKSELLGNRLPVYIW